MNTSVASVTALYNSERVLARHIESLLGQTRPLQEIIVVDNASTDGTAKILAEDYPQVTVVRLAKNLGAAGAWAVGLEYAALTRQHDWVWAFDDDSVPSPDALEMLVDAVDYSNADNNLGMIAGLPVHPDTGIPYPPLLWENGFVRPSLWQLNEQLWFADLIYASGSMVRREVVEMIGLPRADFFMDFFDFEYCLRARKHGYKICVVNHAKFAHEVGRARPVRVFGRSRLWPNHAPWREYYMSRNLVYAVWWLYPNMRTKQFAMRHLVRHAGGVVLFGSNKGTSLKRMAQGFLDGVRARLGVRFVPQPEQHA